MAHVGFSRSQLARETGVDRSTIGQILAEGTTRLPNAQLAADAAQALGVSTDWLLGLTERPERPGDVIAAAMSVTKAERRPADQQILDWHHEAAGYKIRHVPATLPDSLKTEDMLRWEYAACLGVTPEQAIETMRSSIERLRSGDSDYEIALPLHELHALAEGSGYYRGLDIEIRREQLRQMAAICDELYPALRLFLFDAREVFSAPMSVFGPILSVIFVGRFFLAFRESERIKSMTTHFDWLVREAKVDARDTAAFINALADNLTDDMPTQSSADQSTGGQELMFSTVRHDLRTSLSVLLAQGEKLSGHARTLSPSELESAGRAIRHASASACTMLAGLTDGDLLRGNRASAVQEIFEVADIIDAALDLLKPLADEKDIRITLHREDGLEAIGDAQMIEAVLRNLIGNAVKFTSPGGTVTVETCRTGHEVTVQVTDDGVGMTPDQTEAGMSGKQVMSLRGTDGERGTGTGLALCHKLLKENNGRLKLVSTSGHGTKAIITLISGD